MKIYNFQIQKMFRERREGKDLKIVFRTVIFIAIVLMYLILFEVFETKAYYGHVVEGPEFNSNEYWNDFCNALPEEC